VRRRQDRAERAPIIRATNLASCRPSPNASYPAMLGPISAATAITSILIALRMVRVDLILLYGLPDFGLPDFVLVGRLARLLTLVLLLVRIFLVLIGHRDLLLFLSPLRLNI
jgi:hypothetical protein